MLEKMKRPERSLAGAPSTRVGSEGRLWARLAPLEGGGRAVQSELLEVPACARRWGVGRASDAAQRRVPSSAALVSKRYSNRSAVRSYAAMAFFAAALLRMSPFSAIASSWL